MFGLKDSQGRAVVVRNAASLSFWAKCGDTLEQVPEATICKTDDVHLSPEYMHKRCVEAGYDWVFPIINMKEWDCIGGVVSDYQWAGNWNGSKKTCTINGKRVEEHVFNNFNLVKTELRSYTFLAKDNITLQGKCGLKVQTVLELIGECNVVTPGSLNNGCAKGESRARLFPGDSVEILDKKGNVTGAGTILRMSSKATVVKQEGKSNIVYNQLRRSAKAVSFDVSGLEPTIKENLDFVLKVAKTRLYRAKTEKKDLASPMFPEPNERQIELKDAQTCICPLCGWQMADFNRYGSDNTFSCCFCKAEGQVISKTDDEVVLLMSRQPAKNRFCIKETRCCGNCGIFQFEVGRQGKRSTGYCQTTNQCVQGFNTCNYWFPVDPTRYGSQMRQHITNLGYGVEDKRNTERNDIRDTVYREDDHKKEQERAETAKSVFTQAHSGFLSKLTSLAEKAKVHGTTLEPEELEEWRKVLDDGC